MRVQWSPHLLLATRPPGGTIVNVVESSAVPELVAQAQERARLAGFSASCEPPTGSMLAVLAASTPARGAILELGTGCCVGTAWLVSGLADRDDVRLVTVERDAELVAAARSAGLPGYVEVVHADAEAVLPELGTFDLVFADAEGGKWSGLDLTIDALAAGGVLLVDDMDETRYGREDHRASVSRVRTTLLTDARLMTAELSVGSGLMLSSRAVSA